MPELEDFLFEGLDGIWILNPNWTNTKTIFILIFHLRPRLSWHKFLNEINAKTCLDLYVLLRPRPRPGLDPPSLDFQYQYQESCWTLICIHSAIGRRNMYRLQKDIAENAVGFGEHSIENLLKILEILQFIIQEMSK